MFFILLTDAYLLWLRYSCSDKQGSTIAIGVLYLSMISTVNDLMCSRTIDISGQYDLTITFEDKLWIRQQPQVVAIFF